MKIDGCQSNLYVILNQLLFFYKFDGFFCRRHSLMNRPCYNNLFQFMKHDNFRNLKALSGLSQFLAIESLLKMMKNAFYFTSKAVFVLKVFNFLSWLFGHVAKQLNWKDKVNVKFYDVTTLLTNNCNTHIALYLEK